MHQKKKEQDGNQQDDMMAIIVSIFRPFINIIVVD